VDDLPRAQTELLDRLENAAETQDQRQTHSGQKKNSQEFSK
jgi:hypothetical protein